jgi:hypothetical protein
MRESFKVLVCGPIIGRVNIANFAANLNTLAFELSQINPKSGVHIQTYESDSSEIKELLQLSDSLSINTTPDPGPDKEFYSSKGYENTSRMFRIGVDGLENLASVTCCKTRAELIPDATQVKKFIAKIQQTLNDLRIKGSDSVAILQEHYGGPLAYRKGTLCSIADTFIIADTSFLLKVFIKAEKIWLDYKALPMGSRIYAPVNEQFLGRAYYECSQKYDTSFLVRKFDFKLRGFLIGRSLEKSKIVFFSYSSFGFATGRFSNTTKSVVSKNIVILNKIPIARRLIDILFLFYRLRKFIYKL